MYFYSVEVFQPFLERLLPGISCEDLFKVTVLSDTYKYDLEAHHAVQDLINELLVPEEQENIAIQFNEDYFPVSLCYDEEELAENEVIDEEELNAIFADDSYEISIDGLPRTERDLTIHDYIQTSYTLGDAEMEALQVRINVIISPEAAEFIDFETNTTVH